MINNIRDLRESKNISQVALAVAVGVSEGVLQRIESGSTKTTQDEIDKVLKVLNKMKQGDRKIAGRPFNDAAKQAAVAAARETGTSVAEVIAATTPAPAKKTAAPAAKKAAAPAAKKAAPAKAGVPVKK